MEQVQVGRGGQREGLPHQAEARLQQRQVELLAVEGDHAGEGAQVLGQAVQERRLFVVVAHEVLPHAEAVAVHEADAHQERGGAGAARQAGRLRVQEDRARQVEALQGGIAGQRAHAGRRGQPEAAQREVAVQRLQVHVVLDAEELAARVGHAGAGHQLLDGNGRGHAGALLRRPAAGGDGGQPRQPLT